MGCGWARLVGVFVVGGFRGCRLWVLLVRGVRHWWGLVMGACPRLHCLGVSLGSPLAGDGGCLCSPSPSFVSPGCMLLFTVGGGCSSPLVSPRWVLVSTVCGGWWWVLVLALALVHGASLRAPIGGGCSDPFMSPRWVLVSAIGGGWWWALAPVGAPRCVLTRVHVAGSMSPLLRVIVVVSVGGVLLDVYMTRGLTIV